MNTPQQGPTPPDLQSFFTPLYSYQLPPWWQTPAGKCYIAGGITLAAACIAWLAWYRWWYKPPLTLPQWRAKELEALTALLTRQPVNYKRFFGAATFFVKQYLSKLYGWSLLDKTDDELWSFLQTKEEEFPPSLHEPIKDLLLSAQMVKFADADVLADKAALAQEHVATITHALYTRWLHSASSSKAGKESQ